MDCATEENEIRQALSRVGGISELRFQLASRTLAIRAEPAALGEAETILRRLSYPPELIQAGAPHRLSARACVVPADRGLILAAAGEVIHTLLPPSWLHEALEITLALGAIPLAGLPVYTKGWRPAAGAAEHQRADDGGRHRAFLPSATGPRPRW